MANNENLVELNLNEAALVEGIEENAAEQKSGTRKKVAIIAGVAATGGAAYGVYRLVKYFKGKHAEKMAIENGELEAKAEELRKAGYIVVLEKDVEEAEKRLAEEGNGNKE